MPLNPAGIMAGDGAGRRMKPSWINLTIEQRKEFQRILPPVGWRILPGSELPSVLPEGLRSKTRSTLVFSQPTLTGGTHLIVSANRVDSPAKTIDSYWSDWRLCVRRPLGGPFGVAAGPVLAGGFEVRNRLEALGRDRGPTAQEAPPRRRRGDSASPRSRGQHYFVLVGRPHALRTCGRRMARTQ